MQTKEKTLQNKKETSRELNRANKDDEDFLLDKQTLFQLFDTEGDTFEEETISFIKQHTKSSTRTPH